MSFKHNWHRLRSKLSGGKHRNALKFNHNQSLAPADGSADSSPLLSNTPLVKNLLADKSADSWLAELDMRKADQIQVPAELDQNHHKIIFDRYDSVVSNLLNDMATAAHWNRLGGRARILRKQGEKINGWGWVVYRVHSTGEALLPEDATPRHYTIFNFWQVSFSNGFKAGLEPDFHTWHLHAYDTLEDFERLLPGKVENWLKEQLYRMYKTGCMWVALPELVDEKGRQRKPTIEDALYHFSLIGFGRNYDLYQTNKHFFDRPSQLNQFVPGHFKR